MTVMLDFNHFILVYVYNYLHFCFFIFLFFIFVSLVTFLFIPFFLFNFEILWYFSTHHDYFTFLCSKYQTNTFLQYLKIRYQLFPHQDILLLFYSSKIRPSEYFFFYFPFPTITCYNFQNAFPLPICPIPNQFLGFADI